MESAGEPSKHVKISPSFRSELGSCTEPPVFTLHFQLTSNRLHSQSNTLFSDRIYLF
jgi:hypothetical protein